VIIWAQIKKQEGNTMKNYLTVDQLSDLPIEVVAKVMSTLRAFKECNITFEYGRYEVNTGYMLKSSYGSDHRIVGEVRAADVYTEDERTQNYIECFHDYPHEYKGKRDYAALRRQYGESPDMN
jgi:hypothetical protein